MSVFNTLPIKKLEQKTKYYMDDSIKKYKIGDIIYYSGKCHEYSKFYACIDKINQTGMDITILELEYDKDNINFYKTESQIKGLTRRPFYLIDN